MRPTAIPAALICWLLFVAAGVAGLFTGLLALPFRKTRRYTSDLVHAQDCAAAAFLGFSGEKTISKEVGLILLAADAAGVKAPLHWRALDAVLSAVLEPNHCRKEASK